MVVNVKDSEGVKLLIEKVARAIWVPPKELIEYYEWKANREKLKKSRKRMTEAEVRKIIVEWKKEKPRMSEEKAVKLYYEAGEEI